MRRKMSTARRTALSPSHGVDAVGGRARHLHGAAAAPPWPARPPACRSARRRPRSRPGVRRAPASGYSSPPARHVPRPGRRSARPERPASGPRQVRRWRASSPRGPPSCRRRRGRRGDRRRCGAELLRVARDHVEMAVEDQPDGAASRPAPQARRPPVSTRSTAAPRASSQPATKSVARRDAGAAGGVVGDQPLGELDLVHRGRIAESPELAGREGGREGPGLPWTRARLRRRCPRPPGRRPGGARRAAGVASPSAGGVTLAGTLDLRRCADPSRRSPWSAASAPRTATARFGGGGGGVYRQIATGSPAAASRCCATTSAASATRRGANLAWLDARPLAADAGAVARALVSMPGVDSLARRADRATARGATWRCGAARTAPVQRVVTLSAPGRRLGLLPRVSGTAARLLAGWWAPTWRPPPWGATRCRTRCRAPRRRCWCTAPPTARCPCRTWRGSPGPGSAAGRPTPHPAGAGRRPLPTGRGPGPATGRSTRSPPSSTDQRRRASISTTGCAGSRRPTGARSAAQPTSVAWIPTAWATRPATADPMAIGPITASW